MWTERVMKCCEKCFLDTYLIELIKDQNNIGNCDFCGSKGIFCVDCGDLTELFMPLAELYVPVIDIYSTGILKDMDDGDYLWDKLNFDWEIFDDLDYTIQADLTQAILPSNCLGSGSLDSWVEDRDGFYETRKSFSEELKENWQKFCDELKYKNRFFVSEKINLDIILDLIEFLHNPLNEKSICFRSRISEPLQKFQCTDMGKPPCHKSSEGRANPKGIPYLYLASDIETAISEVKPYVNDSVTVGKFKAIKPLSLIDLRDPKLDSPFKYGDKLRYFLMHLDFLRILGNELSKPINPSSSILEYLPLQYLCEFIKNAGYDGVVYNSSLSKGYNLAIFNDFKLECVETELYIINQISFQYNIAAQEKNSTLSDN